MHPLMAGYALAAAVLLFLVGTRRYRAAWIACAAALACTALLQALAPHESPDYLRVAFTRYYWFPSEWQWYERLGLIAPIILIAALLFRDRYPAWKALAHSTLLLAALSLAAAALFAHHGLATHLVARMQPLRCFQIVYIVMILMLGATLGELLLKSVPWRWGLTLAAFGAIFFAVQRATYPASAHLELPGRASPNPWVQAFVWARQHTDPAALFALDAHYITTDGEDAQCFRAIAERSALPDYSKDGGEAAITPSLTSAWVIGQAAQTGLNTLSDADRNARLAPLGVEWIVLNRTASTGLACPYANAVVKVCRLR
jgi:hypothetical protein